MGVAAAELEKLLAQQQAVQSSPLIAQISEGGNIAKAGDVQRASGLLTGIGARKRLNAQQEFNNKQAIAALPGQIEAQQLQAFKDDQIFQHDLRQEEITTAMAEMELERVQMGAPLPGKVIDTAFKMASERERQLAPSVSALQSYDAIAALDVQGMSPSGATALIFKFVQSMDNTAVRDGERQMITSQGGEIAEFVNKWNQMSGKGALAQTAWDDMIDTATTLAEASFKTATRINENWDKREGDYAKRFLMPALIGATASTAFNPDRTFGRQAETPTPETTVTPQTSATDAIPGFTAN